MFYYPVKAKEYFEDLRKKDYKLEATVKSSTEKRQVNRSSCPTALDDAKALQEQLVKGIEKFFTSSLLHNNTH